jgi:GT2 family glycosyltransferase
MNELLTVVVCTHDRADDAVACIDALLAHPDESSIPVILVDSASAPEHAEKLVGFAARHQNVILKRSDGAGLSIARNIGIESVKTPWIGFLDDDARPSDDWWDAALAIVRDAPAGVAMVGGRIMPSWPGKRPDHVGVRWLSFLSCIEDVEQDSANPLPHCHGANMLVSRAMAQEVGGFPADLGRIGTRLLSNEETVLQYRLLANGRRIVYDGRLVVDHLIGPERLTTRWIKQRAYWGGVSEVFTARKVGYDARHLNPVKAVVSTLLFRVLRLFGDRHTERLIRAHYAAGVLAAWWWSRGKPGDSGVHQGGVRQAR